MYIVRQTDKFRRWLANLKDRRARVLIAARIIRLEEGLMGDAVTVGRGVSEMRIHYGPGYRIYFMSQGREIIMLLCGGDKGTQKRDIVAALELADRWRNSDG